MVPPASPPSFPVPAGFEARDERAHPPGGDEWWGEAWVYSFAGPVRGHVRVGLLPNQGVCWYWAVVLGDGRSPVVVIDDEVAIPRRVGLELRTEGLWADHIVEVPFDHFTLGCEAFALLLDEPIDPKHASELRGERLPFGLDLEWETTGEARTLADPRGYQLPCRVHGEVLVADARIALDTNGSREHTWGVDKWSPTAWLDWLTVT